MDIYKSLSDAELIYNISGLSNCDILHLLRSDWSNMELIQVLHPYVILFLLLIGFIYFGVYFLCDVSPIHTFSSTFLAPIKPHSDIGDIILLCSSLTKVWSRFFFLYNSTINFDKQRVFFIGGMYYMRVILSSGM